MVLPKIKKFFEIKLGSLIRMSVFLPIMIICAIHFEYGPAFFTAYTAALLHELAHILCAKLLNVKISHITLYPFGVTAALSEGYIKSSPKEFVIAFAGPFLNILLFWLCNAVNTFFRNDILLFFGDMNLAICVVNLIPTLPLDGGRMLKSILVPKFGTIRAYNFSVKLSRFLSIALLALSFCILPASGFNFSLVLISAFLLHNLGHEQASISRITLKEILENSQKLNQKNFFNTKTFLVKDTTRASRILKLLSYDYYCIFHLLDSNSHIVRTLTETQVLDALTKYGIGIKFREI